MPISFRCSRCHKDVTAPDAAGGKRGRCPFCGESNYIPSPVSEADVLPLAPLDEEEEALRQAEARRLHQVQRQLLAESRTADPAVPLEQKENLTAADLYHYVVNFCLDMAAANRERAARHAADLARFGPAARQAVGDFAAGKVAEPALAKLTPRQMQTYLAELRRRMG